MSRIFDWLHNHTCGDDTVFFRFYQFFYVECPCCHWYRGVGVGAVAGLVVGMLL